MRVPEKLISLPNELARLPICEQRNANIAPIKPRISAARRGGRMRTTSMTSREESPAAASARKIISRITSG